MNFRVKIFVPLAVLFTIVTNVNIKAGSDIFCNIISGKQPGRVLVKGDNSSIIESLSGRPLSIPHKHIATLKEINEVYLAAQRYFDVPYFADKPYNYAYFHTGSRAGQTVFHIHMHMASRNNTLAKMNLEGMRVCAEDEHAQIFIGAQNDLLFTVPKKALGHLDSFELKTIELAHALILGSKFLKEGLINVCYRFLALLAAK